MAKFLCVCGETIRTSGEIPNPDQWMIMSDVELDQYTGQVDRQELYLRMRIMFRCPRSGHLYIYWDGFDKPPKVYEPLNIRIPPDQ